MKKTMHIIGTIINLAITFACFAALAAAIFSFMTSRKTGEPITILGYRPVYVLTGSMEPFMMTDSIVITKQFGDADTIREGDVITFHVKNEEGKNLVITHRIKQIDENGTITTKGDNNRVADAIPITRDNIDAKVVVTLNWIATLIHMWATRKGKIILICALSGIVLLLLGFRILISKDPDEGHKNGMATAK